jgi:hypothetical protein
METGQEWELRARKRGRRLCRAGWVMFGLALVLPAVYVQIMFSSGGSWWPGWSCMWISYDFAWDVLKGGDLWRIDFGSILFTGLAAANTLMMASPLLNRIFRKRPRALRRLGLAELGGTGLVAYYVLASAWGAIGSIGPGAYAWLLSFAMLSAGTLQLSKRRPIGVGTHTQLPVSRTEEEMAAIRELEDYLRGIERPKYGQADEERHELQNGPVTRSSQTHRPVARIRAARA